MKKVITLVISLFASTAYGDCVINPPEYNGSYTETYGYLFEFESLDGLRTLDPFLVLQNDWYWLTIRPVSFEIDTNGQHVVGAESDTTLIMTDIIPNP